jgi:hypothetical protein
LLGSRERLKVSSGVAPLRPPPVEIPPVTPPLLKISSKFRLKVPSVPEVPPSPLKSVPIKFLMISPPCWVAVPILGPRIEVRRRVPRAPPSRFPREASLSEELSVLEVPVVLPVVLPVTVPLDVLVASVDWDPVVFWLPVVF